jgi:putative membrane protein
MKKLILIAGAAALVGGCATPMADEPLSAGPADAAIPGMPAPAYIDAAASGDLFEIESSRLALGMSRNPEIRSFAQMLIDDHGRMSNELMATAHRAGLNPPPPQMLPRHLDMLARLRSVGPNEFDRAYKTEQIAAHQEALNLHRTYADNGDVPPLRDVAARAVPIIQAHLAHAERLPEWVPPPPAVGRAGERGR